MAEVSKVQNEKEDLLVPLPDWKKDDLKDVKMHGSKGSPPCLKIVAILQHNQIPFTMINGRKKDSEYKKVPVLLLNGH